MKNAPTNWEGRAVSLPRETLPKRGPLTADGPISAGGHGVPRPTASVVKKSASSVICGSNPVFKIKPNKGKYSDFEPPGGWGGFYPLSLTASHRKPLSPNAFINSVLKINHSKLPHFTPKNTRFFLAWCLEILPRRAKAHRRGSGWSLGLGFWSLPKMALSTPVKRRQGRSTPSRKKRFL
jgi:hypothetical protein